MAQLKKRIDYLDLLKGFAILWIIWYHQPHPELVDHYYHVPIFFFISGIVFKDKSLIDFIKGVVLHIMIPFLFFYLISYCFQISRFLFENKTINGFEWNQIFDLFKQDNYIDYIRINRPLWFLVSLTVIQLLYYIICRIPQFLILIICAIVFIFKEPILSWQTYFMFNQSLYWLIYFALGDILGKWIVKRNESTYNGPNSFLISKWKIVIIISSICLYIAISQITFHNNNSMISNLLYDTKVITFVVVSVLLFSYLKGNNICIRLLRFYGQNSLTVLGIHILVSIFYGGFAFKLIGITGNNLIGFVIFILTSVTMVPIILFINRFLPFCVGKTVINLKASKKT